jgi:hypothetical protein
MWKASFMRSQDNSQTISDTAPVDHPGEMQQYSSNGQLLTSARILCISFPRFGLVQSLCFDGSSPNVEGQLAKACVYGTPPEQICCNYN